MMPGVSIRPSHGRHTSISFSDALDELRHFDHYESEVLVRGDTYQIGYTGYEDYPITTFEDESYYVCLEGRLYDRAEAVETVRPVVPAFFERDTAAVAEWLTDVDGDFVVCAVEKSTGTLAVVNDVFGRLPLYHRVTDDGLLITREPKFLATHAEDVEFDPLAIAEALLFGYMLRGRTLFSDVRKVLPATLVVAGDDGVSAERVHTFDFSEKRHADRTTAENARELASRFVDACRRRADTPGENVISLSGGHDSRSIAAAFRRGGLPCVTATFVRPGSDPQKSADVRIARDTAKAAELDWRLYDPGAGRIGDVDRLLEMKGGHHHVGNPYILRFLDQLRTDCGSDAVQFTGDGGDKIVPDLTPPRTYRTLDDLVSYTISKNSVFPMERAAAIADIDESTVKAEVREVLASYPETSMTDKYVHFLTHERGFNWLFEGEDRSRYYFWSVSPFYDRDVFTYAMNIPDEQKTHNRLYREFLASLWPHAIELDDADFHTPMSSPRYRGVQWVLSLLARYPWLEDLVGVVYRGEVGYEYDENVADIIRTQLRESEAVRGRFNEDELARIAADRRSCNRRQILNLLTLTAAVEKFTSPETVLERREDDPLTF